MHAEFQPPASGIEGVFGPEIVLNARTGVLCLKPAHDSVIGRLPEPPLTNAFMVWLGTPVLVVSAGVHRDDTAVVAAALRRQLNAPDLPVCHVMHRDGAGIQFVISDNPGALPRRELARAEVYVSAQRTYCQAERAVIQIDGERFELSLDIVAIGDGSFRCVVG